MIHIEEKENNSLFLIGITMHTDDLSPDSI